MSGLEVYTAANLGLAWDCVLACAGGDYWHASRGGGVAAVVQIHTVLPPLHREPNHDRLRAEARRAGAASAISVYAQPHEARWADALSARAGTVAMPVTTPRPRPEPRWHCEQCNGTHRLSEIAACTG